MQLNSTIDFNSYNPNKRAVRTRASTSVFYSEHNDKASLFNDIKYTMRLQYYDSEGGLAPWDGADTLRML